MFANVYLDLLGWYVLSVYYLVAIMTEEVAHVIEITISAIDELRFVPQVRKDTTY